MRSPSLAPTALAALRTLDDAQQLAFAIGFRPPALAIEDDARRQLALPDDVVDARILAGPGATRCLLLLHARGVATRELLARLGPALATRTRQVLWLVVALEQDGAQLGIAAWPSVSRPRVAALLADRRHLVASDLESIRALAAALGPIAADDEDALAHARWVEVLGRESLTRRFYRALEQLVARLARDASGDGSPPERAEVALLTTSRLLFLAFLEAKGWLDGDHGYLARRFDRCMADGGSFHRRVLRPLFFGTLNTPPRRRAPAARALGALPFLNGGLFAPTPLERRLGTLRFDDDTLGALLGDLLGRYRFTAHEESAALAEVAVDPEMLGRAFESLMAAHERRETGAFYTPQPIVERITDEALALALASPRVPPETVARALAGDFDGDGAATLLESLRTVTVLDPACGSGAFLVHALERLAALARLAGDARPIAELRRELLTRSIFGVDRNPTAVWLCELRLWLSVVVESREADPMRVAPLPNLDRNIRVGDALTGGGFDEDALRRGGGALVRRLRTRYAQATGARKAALARALDREERRRAIALVERALDVAVAARRDALLALRGRDLFGQRPAPSLGARIELRERRARVQELRRERRRLADGGALPFRFDVQFADVALQHGFAAVVGNPPWVRMHRIPASARATLRRDFFVHRHAAWEAGAAHAHAGHGFAAQVDLAALFVERALALLRPGGTLSLLLPAKLWRTLAGGGVRRLLREQARLRRIEDWSDGPDVFDATTYPSLLVAQRAREDDAARPEPACLQVAIRRRGTTFAWSAPVHGLALDDTPGSPWLLLPDAVRAGVDRLRRAGIPLGASELGRPTLGVKSGCNAAFVVAVESRVGPMAQVVAADGRRGRVESALLRPLVAGHALSPWRPRTHAAHLLWTHDEQLEPLTRLPVHAARWLAPMRRRLERRTDARGDGPWWSLFRLEAADRTQARVVWGDVGRAPRAIVLEAGDPAIPLNSCYVVRCRSDDAHALAALLNGPLASAWLAALAEPARGGYHRYLAWTMALLPIPRDWPRARAILAPLARRGAAGDALSAAELLAASLEAYRVRAEQVAPLLTWFGA